METSEPNPRAERQNQGFATTRWSIVVAAGRRSSPASKQALAVLCEAYWFPLYAYVRRRVSDANEAQDLTQAFFAEMLEKNFVGSATPDRGRFRAFLLTSFKHFLSKAWDKAKAQKRGGGRSPLSLDFAAADSRLRIDPAAGLTPEQHYDQQWAIALLGNIMARLAAELAEKGKAEHFAALKSFLIGDHATTTYAEVAARLNMSEAPGTAPRPDRPDGRRAGGDRGRNPDPVQSADVVNGPMP
jgi:DNA-directed RNA polymerase specialized sigma24 family protein